MGKKNSCGVIRIFREHRRLLEAVEANMDYFMPGKSIGEPDEVVYVEGVLMHQEKYRQSNLEAVLGHGKHAYSAARRRAAHRLPTNC